MLTEREADYIRDELLPKKEAELELAKEKEIQARKHGDLRENAEFEQAKNAVDGLQSEIHEWNRLLKMNIHISRSSRISIGNQVLITPVNADTFDNYLLHPGPNGELHKTVDLTLGQYFVISEVLNLPEHGFLNKTAPILNQVLGKPSGTYTITTPKGKKRTYSYEVQL